MHTVQAPFRVIRPRASVVVVVSMLVACGGGDRQPSSDTGAAAAASGSAAATPGAPATAAASGGEQLYQRCVTCHQANGQGLPGSFPPLAGSEFANASNPAVPIRVVMHGLQGPVTVKGTQYDSVMPAGGTGIDMSDEEIASVLTYVRSSWGSTASAITAEDVAKVRATPRSATGPVTAKELEAMM